MNHIADTPAQTPEGEKGPLHVLQVIGGSEFGGAVWIILSYVEMLKSRGFEVSVVTSNEGVAKVYSEAGCEIIAVPEMRREINPFRDAAAFRKLRLICKRRNIDIVHTHTSKGGFLGRAAARSARVPVIIHTAHGFAFHENSSKAAIKTYAFLESRAARWCDRITTVSDFHREWALRLGIASNKKIMTVHNGIAPDRLEVNTSSAITRNAFGITDNQALIGVIGRLAPGKGLEVILDSFPGVLAKHPQARLLIVGDGPEAGSLKSMQASLGLTGQVIFTGFRQDIGNILNACDLVVSPTLREGLSVSILEAMALAKPIVTTDISSNKELVEHMVSGILIPPLDAAALTQAIISLIEDPGRAVQFGENAFSKFQSCYSEKMMQEKMWMVYKELIDNTVPND
ncbi:MAG: glycosyltransferase family 4 protein [Thermoleophilia bacterium]